MATKAICQFQKNKRTISLHFVPEGDSQSEKSAMGDYPGADYTMSLYGLKDRNPGEVAGQWKEYIQVFFKGFT